MRQQLKLWDSKREREKINRPEHTAGRLQNKGSEQVQRLWTGPAPPQAGGRGEGKGANSAPKTASPTTLQTGLQFLTKDFLRFWRVVAKHKAHAPNRRGWKVRLGPRRGECARQAPGCLSWSGQGRHKTQAQLSPRFCGIPGNWNRMQCRARTI